MNDTNADLLGHLRIQIIAMRSSGRQLVLLTLSGVLLVNLGLSKADGELVKQESPLPALVPIEDESPVSTSAPRTTTSETTVASLPTKITTDSPTSSTSSPEVKEASKSIQEGQPDSSKDRTVQPVKESSDSTTASADDSGSSQRKAPAAEEGTSSDKDIRILLATKNDAENDLNSPSMVQDKLPPASPPVVVVADKKELDAPVDINGGGESVKPQTDAYDNRFHYSLAGSPDKPLSVSDSVEQPTTTTRQPSKPDESKEGTEGVLNSEKPADGVQKEAEPSKEASPDTLTGKKIDDKVKHVAVDPVPETKPDSAPADRLSPSDEKPNPEIQPAATTTSTTTTTTTTTTQLPESSTSSPAVRPSGADSGSSPAQDKAKDAAPKEAESAPKARPQLPEESPKSEGGEVKNTTLVSEQPKKPADAADKPVSVPSILAVALGTALGGAVNPLLKTQNRDKPVVPNPAVPATRNSTTKAPSTTTRKSSTDKWDRWLPTTGAPPTRLRPILPSIRRRFRPYNRFSPFPFGGPDSYSPLDTDFSSQGDPSFGQGASRRSPVPPLPSTSRPSRRRGSSTEPPKSTETGSSEESEDEVTSKPQDSSSRRRGQGSNRRRHHHHHHHHGPNRGESEVGERRYYNKNHGTRHSEREEPFGSDGQSFSDGHHRHHPRPISPGFSLFNTGTTGTGFDLLNPFSGWLDDAIKPRPPARGPVGQSPGSTLGSPGRRPGSQPIPVEGDYNDEPEHGHHHHNHRPHNGREDYYDHHHDCDHHHDHDHDHDHHHDHHHREPYRPGRPHREPMRPPVGGDYEPYSPSASFGRRPSRPYNRRDQTESNGNEQNGSAEQSSPGLYANIAPVAPRRVPSIFSPFDSLFGSLDDDLFSLRSSFVDAPAKAQESSHAFDTILSSPKISMPSVESHGKEGEDKANKQPESAIKPTGEQEAPNNGKQTNIGDVGRRAQRAHDNNDCAGFRRGSLWCLILSI